MRHAGNQFGEAGQFLPLNQVGLRLAERGQGRFEFFVANPQLGFGDAAGLVQPVPLQCASQERQKAWGGQVVLGHLVGGSSAQEVGGEGFAAAAGDDQDRQFKLRPPLDLVEYLAAVNALELVIDHDRLERFSREPVQPVFARFGEVRGKVAKRAAVDVPIARTVLNHQKPKRPRVDHHATSEEHCEHGSKNLNESVVERSNRDAVLANRSIDSTSPPSGRQRRDSGPKPARLNDNPGQFSSINGTKFPIDETDSTETTPDVTRFSACFCSLIPDIDSFWSLLPDACSGWNKDCETRPLPRAVVRVDNTG